MKLSNLLFSGLLLFINSTYFSFATETVLLRPLIGSDWAKKNPGKLPYSKCSLIREGYDLSRVPLTKRGTWDSPRLSNFEGANVVDGGVVLGGPLGLGDDSSYIGCVSLKHRLAYSLPLVLRSGTTFFDIGLGLSKPKFHLNSQSINHLKVESFLKTFVGPSFAFTLIGGGSVSAYRNSSGIKVRLSSPEYGMHLNIGLSTLKFSASVPRVGFDDAQKDIFLLLEGTETKEIVKSNSIVFQPTPDSFAIQIQGNTYKRNIGTKTVFVEIPEGSLARWNGDGFEVDAYVLPEKSEQIPVTFTSVTAIDGSKVYGFENGQFLAKKEAGLYASTEVFLIHDLTGTTEIHRKDYEPIDLE